MCIRDSVYTDSGSTDGLEEVTFTKEPVTPKYPNFVEYELDSENWTITPNEEKGTYAVTISGSLNFPTREEYDNAVSYTNLDVYKRQGL